jgi:hypothetical protein
MHHAIGLLMFFSVASFAAYDPPSKFKECKESGECIEVSTTCNDCCEVDAINKSFQLEFDQQHEKFCRLFKERAVCSCMKSQTVAKCESGLCVLKGIDVVATMIVSSPSQAEIFFKGKSLHFKTPARIPVVGKDLESVTVKLNGFEIHKVDRSMKNRLSFELRKAPE